MALDYDGASDGIFTHIGAVIAEYDIQGAIAADVELEAQTILDPFQLGDRDLLVDGLPTQARGWIAEYIGRRSYLAGLVQNRLLQRESVLEEIGAVTNDLAELFRKLFHRMLADAETINRNTVTIGSVTADAENTGNGTVLTTKLLDAVSSPGAGPLGSYPAIPDYAGLDSELALNESMIFRCLKDADADGIEEGTESFLWTGGPAHAAHGVETNRGSGTIGAIQNVHAASLLSNLDFENFTTTDEPDDWDIDSGTPGTHINETATHYHGVKALQFTGDGAQAAIQISQTLAGIGTSIRAGRLYLVTARIKADATIAAGTLTIQFEATGGYSASSTEKIEIAAASLPTSWTLNHFWIVMPDSMADDFQLVVKWTGTPTTGKSVFIDDMSFSEGRYGGGIAAAVVRGNIAFVREDRFTLDVTNDEVGLFQTWLRDVYGVQLPSAASPTISDGLAG